MENPESGKDEPCPPPSEIAIGPLVAPPHEDGAPMIEGLCKDEFSRVQYVEIKEGSQGCYLKNDSHEAKRIDLELVFFYSCSVHQEQDRNSNSLQDLQDLKQ